MLPAVNVHPQANLTKYLLRKFWLLAMYESEWWLGMKMLKYVINNRYKTALLVVDSPDSK